MNGIHVYVTSHQPATNFLVKLDGMRGKRFKRPARSTIYTDCCRRWRWAGRCTVQVYYDNIYAWCRPGTGCKQKGKGK